MVFRLTEYLKSFQTANIISGVTLHSFLKIPINKKGQEMKPADGTLGEKLQHNCEGLKVLLVDERSLPEPAVPDTIILKGS
jgi:hypothetical protein